jgi:hypothetical protein
MPVSEEPAADIGRLCELGSQARQQLQDGHSVVAYLQVLIETKLYEDGLRLLAHALPKREAVWWACQCAGSVAGEPALPDRDAALAAAEAWAVDPSDTNRRAAYQAATKAGFGTPAGCAALAAFFSGGSLGPPDQPAVPPPPLVTAQLVGNGVLLAGLASEPMRAPERYDQFLKQGLLLASGATALPGRPTRPEEIGARR